MLRKHVDQYPSNNQKKLWFGSKYHPDSSYDIDFHVTLYVFTTLFCFEDLHIVKQKVLETNIQKFKNETYWARHIIAPVETIIRDQLKFLPKQATGTQQESQKKSHKYEISKDWSKNNITSNFGLKMKNIWRPVLLKIVLEFYFYYFNELENDDKYQEKIKELKNEMPLTEDINSDKKLDFYYHKHHSIPEWIVEGYVNEISKRPFMSFQDDKDSDDANDDNENYYNAKDFFNPTSYEFKDEKAQKTFITQGCCVPLHLEVYNNLLLNNNEYKKRFLAFLKSNQTQKRKDDGKNNSPSPRKKKQKTFVPESENTLQLYHDEEQTGINKEIFDFVCMKLKKANDEYLQTKEKVEKDIDDKKMAKRDSNTKKLKKYANEIALRKCYSKGFEEIAKDFHKHWFKKEEANKPKFPDINTTAKHRDYFKNIHDTIPFYLSKRRANGKEVLSRFLC